MSDCSEKFFKLVAQAFQPVSRKQVSRARLEACATKGGGHGGPPHQPFHALWVGQRPMKNSLEKFFKSVAQAFQPVPRKQVSRAQAFQPVSRKQVSRAQAGKAVPPVNTRFSCFTGGPKAHE